MSLSLFLYLLATILIGLAAFGINPPRVALGWLGLALAVFTFGVLPALTP